MTFCFIQKVKNFEEYPGCSLLYNKMSMGTGVVKLQNDKNTLKLALKLVSMTWCSYEKWMKSLFIRSLMFPLTNVLKNRLKKSYGFKNDMPLVLVIKTYHNQHIWLISLFVIQCYHMASWILQYSTWGLFIIFACFFFLSTLSLTAPVTIYFHMEKSVQVFSYSTEGRKSWYEGE